VMARTTCRGCGRTLDPTTDATGCPACGSRDRLIATEDEAGVTAREVANVLGRQAGKKKPVVEIRAGDDLSHKTEQWNHKKRVIDRENDRYLERITDAAGNVVHRCAEPLSQHRGHGSAKARA
jgi:hypothetical protein